MFGLLEKPVVPAPVPAPKPALVDPVILAKYKETANAVGFYASFGPSVLDKFLDVMNRKNWPIYPLSRVIRYMDAKVGKEGKHGWRWLLLRQRDGKVLPANFKTGHNNRFSTSDFYDGSLSGVRTYSLPVPLHALEKVQAIDAATREFSHDDSIRVAFMVTDYAPKPQFEPDPFLLAVVPVVRDGRAGWDRYVVDFWDEPGFGIAEQLDVAMDNAGETSPIGGFTVTDKKLVR